MKPGPDAAGPAAVCTALVLSGGCLRGLAQIGALKALVAAGIRPDLVVGSSVGAVIGALYAAGRTPAEIECAAHELVVARLQRWACSRDGLWRMSGLRALVRQHPPCRQIEDFPIRFAAVATDLTDGRAAVFTQGDACDAVAASAAMPGFFVPQVVERRSYADGCLSSPLPVGVARALGGRRVIAVNTLCDTGSLQAAGLLNALLRPWRVILRSLAALEAADGDLIIAPDLAAFDVTASHHRRAVIDAGERAAAALLQAWTPA
jgi:NTE family protein